jgi:hypothetical protein
MQSARQPNIDRDTAAHSPRGPATNRTEVWFSDDAVQRRRRSMPAGEETPSRPTVSGPGPSDLAFPSYAEIHRRAQARRAAYVWKLLRRIFATPTTRPRRASTGASTPTASGTSTSAPTVWRRPELFGCVALVALMGAVTAWPGLDAGTRPCRTDPLVLAPGADLALTMTVAHNAACSVSTRAENVTVADLKLAVAPQHGDLALRGRTGVTYRPSHEFTGDDFFAFELRRRSLAGDENSLVRVRVIVK